MRSVIFVAPVGASHGQGAVSATALSIAKKKFEVSLFDTFCDRNIGSYLLNVIKLLFFLAGKSLQHYDLVYFTPSRESPGAIRDVLLLSFIWFRLIRTGRLIGHLHGSDLKQYLERRNPIAWIVSCLYRALCPELIVLSNSHAQYIPNYRFRDVHILKNPAQISHYREPAVRPKRLSKFVFISFPHKDKGLDSCLEFLNKFDGVSLMVIGWTRQDFEAMYGVLSAVIPIEFVGVLNQDTVNERLRESDALILTSRYASEAQPLVVINALFDGMPVFLSSHKLLTDFSSYPGVYYVEKLAGLPQNHYRYDGIMSNREVFSEETFSKAFIRILRE